MGVSIVDVFRRSSLQRVQSMVAADVMPSTVLEVVEGVAGWAVAMCNSGVI